MSGVRLTSMSHGGGCGCKIAPAALTEILAKVPRTFFDPALFGRIAATNALSDIYAMGARPIFALAIVGMPLDELPVNVIQDILAGGVSVCEAAGIPIAGGHSID